MTAAFIGPPPVTVAGAGRGANESRGSGGSEGQSRAVHAVAQARRLRSVGEDVAEMDAAAGAEDFGPAQDETVVRTFDHGMRQGPEEARPAGAAVELGGRGIKRQGAAGAGEGAAAMLMVER